MIYYTLKENQKLSCRLQNTLKSLNFSVFFKQKTSITTFLRKRYFDIDIFWVLNLSKNSNYLQN